MKDPVWKIFTGYTLLLFFILLCSNIFGQINIVQYNAEWNDKNKVTMPCDSIDYSIQSTQSGLLSTTLTLNGTANVPGIVTSWNWAACHSSLCFSDLGQSVTFNQFITTDTIKLCLMTIIDINNTTLTCNQCDSLVWDNGWILLHGGNPVSIQDINRLEQDNKIYDILGREFYDYNSIPIGTIYIKNKKKFIK